jgi:hypothetical protein
VYKLKSLVLIILTQLILTNAIALCSATAFNAQAVTAPELYIDPSSYTAQRIGETFNVNVNICNVDVSQELIFAQFRVLYNDTLLQPVNVQEGTFLQQFPNSAQPPYTYFINYTEDNRVYGPDVLVGILLNPNATGQWTNYPYGNGTLATITFQVLYRPIDPSPPASCLLNLTNTMLVGDIPGQDNVTEIANVAASATYYAQPIPIPTLSIQPSIYQGTLLGETFNVTVDINNLDPDWKMIFAQFRVQYDPTMLSAINVYEGSFLQQFPNSAQPPYTFFINYTEDNRVYGPDVLVGILLNPNATGQWTNYPYGNGTLATITFQIINQPSYPQGSVTSNLVLNNTLLVEDLNATDVGEIPTNSVNGALQISPPAFTYAPAEPSAGEVTIFTVPQPLTPAQLTYNWNFGDGITINTTSPTIAHAFPSGGVYNVSLTCILNDEVEATGVQTVTVESYAPLDVTADVGTLHFNGEQTEFTILTTDSGTPVNTTSLEAKLYYDGALISDLTDAIQPVDTGFYRIPYTIPSGAPTGEYTLLVEAQYYGANGATTARFTISSTLTGLITGIQNGIATITNGINTISTNLTAINATLSGLIINNNGELQAQITTDMGTLTTSLNTINAVIGINGNTVTVSSMLGNITTKLNGVQSTTTNTLYIASILSAIAVILALIILMFVRKK